MQCVLQLTTRHTRPHRPTAGPFASIELAHVGLGRFGRRGPKRTARMQWVVHCTPQLVAPGLPSRLQNPLRVAGVVYSMHRLTSGAR